MTPVIDREEVRRDRLRILANGWTPLRNRDKRTFMKDWPRVEVTPELVDEWKRRHGRDLATGARLDNGLCVPDLDIPDRELVDALADATLDIIPELNDPKVPWLVRSSGKASEAWFFRTGEPFGRIRSHRFCAPGTTPDHGKIAMLEIFGGASARQFGVLGAHTVAGDGTVERWYEWRDRSPLDTRMDELALITKAQCFALADAFERIAREQGWQQVMLSEHGEDVASRVYDLTHDMSFDCNDGVTRSVAELREVAHGRDPIRCSASWREGLVAVNRSRCLVSLTRSGHVSVYETASAVTHIEASAQPRSVQGALDELRSKLSANTGRMNHGR